MEEYVPRPAPQGPVPTPQMSAQPASASQPPATTQADYKHHVHHSYIWLMSVRTFFIVLIATIASIASSIPDILAESDVTEILAAGTLLAVIAGFVVVALIVVLAIIVGLYAWSWRHLYFTVGDAEFTLFKGIFNKKTVHVPYQRVQSVDQRATLLQRIFGVCTVSIDTAGGAANKAVTVPYVTKRQAEWLRAELYNRKGVATGGAGVQPVPSSVQMPPVQQAPGNVLDAGDAAWEQIGGVFAGAPYQTGRVSYEYGLTNRELLFAGVSGSSSLAVVLIGVVAVCVQVIDVLVNLFGCRTALLVDNTLDVMGASFAGGFVGAAAMAFLFAAVAVWLVSAVGAVIGYGGFKARRREGRIEVEYGLLQHTYQGVAIDRVQSVVVKQSFIRRIMGYCELSLGKIDSAADSDGSQSKKSISKQGVVIHPFVKVDRVPEILTGLVPEFADMPMEFLPTPARKAATASQPVAACESVAVSDVAAVQSCSATSKPALASAPAAAPFIPVAPVALRRAIIRRVILQGSGFWIAVFAAIFAAVLAWVRDPATGLFLEADDYALLDAFGVVVAVMFVLAVVQIAVDVVGAVLWARESGFAYNRRFMQVRIGGITRQTVGFPRRKIQFGFTRANPLQRLAKTATLCAVSAAGLSAAGTATVLVDVRVEDAQDWLDWLKPCRATC